MQNKNWNIPFKLKQQQGDLVQKVRHRKKWDLDETKKYCEFIKTHKQILQFQQKKQKQRIYNKMSEFIGTRSTHQCRSHHQKVMKRHNSIDQFIKTFKLQNQSIRIQKDYQKSPNLTAKIKHKQNKEKLNGVAKVQQGTNKLLYSGQFQRPKFILKNQIKQKQRKNKTNQNYIQTEKQINTPISRNTNLINWEYLKNYGQIKKELYVLNSKEGKIIQKKQHMIPKTIIPKENNTIEHRSTANYEINQKINNAENENNENLIGKFVLDSSSLLPYATNICESISQKTNSQVINPLLNMGLVQLTEDAIKIKYKQQPYYNIWVQCLKKEEWGYPSYIQNYYCQQYEGQRNINYYKQKQRSKLLTSRQQELSLFLSYNRHEYLMTKGEYLYAPSMHNYQLKDQYCNTQKSSQFKYYQNYYENPFQLQQASVQRRQKKLKDYKDYKDYRDYKDFLKSSKKKKQNCKTQTYTQKQMLDLFTSINQGRNTQGINQYQYNQMVDEQTQRQIQLSKKPEIEISNLIFKLQQNSNKNTTRLDNNSQKKLNFNQLQNINKLSINDIEKAHYISQGGKGLFKKYEEFYLKFNCNVHENVNFDRECTNFLQKDNSIKIERTKEAMIQLQDQHIRQININYPVFVSSQNQHTCKEQVQITKIQ